MTNDQKRLALLTTLEEVTQGIQTINENVKAQVERQQNLFAAVEAINFWLETHPAVVPDDSEDTQPVQPIPAQGQN